MKLIILTLLLSACSSLKPYQYSDGTNGFRIKCHEPKDSCEKLAIKACPKGHIVKDLLYPDIHTNNYLILVDMYIECTEPSALTETKDI